MDLPPDDLERLSDDALLQAYAEGERAAARVLAERLTPRILGHAWRMLGDRAEAEDVAQEALLRLWRIAPDWRPGEAKVSTWLFRVAANLCTDRLRRRRGGEIGLDSVAEPADDRPGPAEALMQDARLRALHAALSRLPPRQRQAVALRHIEEMGNEEIAAIMDISVEAVESLVARGKRALAKALAGRREELGYDEV